MAELSSSVITMKLRTDQPLSFSCLHSLLFSFSKPLNVYINFKSELCTNTSAKSCLAIRSSSPPRPRLPIVSKCASDSNSSSSSSSDLLLLSTIECSDGSLVFQFRDAATIHEAMRKSTDVKKGEDVSAGSVKEENEPLDVGTEIHSNLEHVKSHSEIPQKSYTALECSEDSRSVYIDCSPVKTTSDYVSELSESSLAESPLDINDTEPTNSSEGSIYFIKDTTSDSCATSNVHGVLREEISSNFEKSTSENEARSKFISAEPDSTVDVSNSDAAGVSDTEDAEIKVGHGTVIVRDNYSVDLDVRSATGEGSLDDNSIQLMSASTTTFESETSLAEGLSPGAPVEYVGEDEINSSFVLSEDPSSNNLEEKLIESKTHRSDDSAVISPKLVKLHPTEDTSNKEEILTTGLVLSSGTAYLPHHSKALIGGEDAHFVAYHNWLGVADGIGQWSIEGMNAGLFSQELMMNSERLVSDSNDIMMKKPEEVLVRSAAETQSPGLSTALVAYFNGQTLHVANVGNSGFIIIRNSAIVQQSSPMVHGFNFPLRIGRGDDPSRLIKEYKIDIDEGDVLVTGTDGLFDNLHEEEIMTIVSKSLQENLKPQEIAELLANIAQEVGESSSPKTPLADAAKATGYARYTGGKLDNITVIVSLVQRASNSDVQHV